VVLYPLPNLLLVKLQIRTPEKLHLQPSSPKKRKFLKKKNQMIFKLSILLVLQWQRRPPQKLRMLMLTQFTCFTTTKVKQILTPEKLRLQAVAEAHAAKAAHADATSVAASTSMLCRSLCDDMSEASSDCMLTAREREMLLDDGCLSPEKGAVDASPTTISSGEGLQKAAWQNDTLLDRQVVCVCEREYSTYVCEVCDLMCAGVYCVLCSRP
jgi:hypothetical protein